MEYLSYYMTPTPKKSWEDKGYRTQQILVKKEVFLETLTFN